MGPGMDFAKLMPLFRRLALEAGDRVRIEGTHLKPLAPAQG